MLFTTYLNGFGLFRLHVCLVPESSSRIRYHVERWSEAMDLFNLKKPGVKADIIRHFLKLLPICWGYQKQAMVGAESGHPFFRCCILAKKVCSQTAMISWKRNLICQIFNPLKIQNVVLMKIDEMVNVFLKSVEHKKTPFVL